MNARLTTGTRHLRSPASRLRRAAQFTDVTSAAGVEVTGVRDGAACFGDVDRDGDNDVYVPRDSGSALMLNDGSGTFEDVTAAAIAGLTPSRRGQRVRVRRFQ